ncbi:hypothetical protein BABINDRAFT_41143 [Babjeviella inositovora NRRL Y-12698]|uniref:NAD+ kinase n=1 Tax=Babjeviella inositovora NRRL Y-12698 TaxID=984486 RepID=A0A1E3QIY0_9ASCO|nr:uncharacterized protein BABINDRAFT_41143 [Babjeviella inositovora NRRL Y-12698]ODQ77655.1 hypothetical protein BABINDRAFT_41143 [Babjeviella inositovora NRRL Y-12698]
MRTPDLAAPDATLTKLGSGYLNSVKSHARLAHTANGVRKLAKNLSRATIEVDVKNIIIVTKHHDELLIYLTREVAEWLLRQKLDLDVYVDRGFQKSKRFDAAGIIHDYPAGEGRLKFWTKELTLLCPEKFDLVISLGGDGTVLYISALFQRIVPPVICFSLGSLGFLTNFKFEQFRESLQRVFDKGVKAMLRMRFTARVYKADGTFMCENQILNELVVDRGPSPFVSMLEIYGNGDLLTVAQADGVIVATPTGSTAYSLSAGGSLVHPGVSAISITPICPHTLSFRPILLPDSMTLKVKLPARSRSTAWASFDGRARVELKKGDYVMVKASLYPFPTIVASNTEFIDSVSRTLNWNVREQQKPFVHMLSEKNQKSYHNSKKEVKKEVGSIENESDSDDEYIFSSQ